MSIGETLGTALLAAVVYRVTVLDPTTFSSSYIEWEDTSLTAISNHINEASIVSPAVNPYNYSSQVPYTEGSPEGQAFVLMLYAAHRDCVAAGIYSS
jgi:hypothetical protein